MQVNLRCAFRVTLCGRLLYVTDAMERYRIQQALAYWQELTCVTFQELASAAKKLLFVRDRG